MSTNFMENKPVIETWFPKLIYVVDGVCNDRIPSYEKEIKKSINKTKRTATLNVNSSHLINRSLQKNKIFFDLTTRIEYHARMFLGNLGYDIEYTKTCCVVNMWYNISNKNDFLFPHAHPGSILAGAYYVKTSEENNIIFYDDMTIPYEPPSKITPLSMTTCNYSCVSGRLLLFRSNFLHSTPIQIDEGEKIVISFNINKI